VQANYQRIRTSGVHGPVFNRTEPAVRFARFQKFLWRFGSVPENFSAVRFSSGSRNESDGSGSVREQIFGLFLHKMEKNIDF
jgi:hypothetical protein